MDPQTPPDSFLNDGARLENLAVGEQEDISPLGEQLGRCLETGVEFRAPRNLHPPNEGLRRLPTLLVRFFTASTESGGRRLKSHDSEAILGIQSANTSEYGLLSLLKRSTAHRTAVVDEKHQLPGDFLLARAEQGRGEKGCKTP